MSYHDLIAEVSQYPDAGRGTEGSRNYVQLGLVAEWGEVAGKVKKLNRGDYSGRWPEWQDAISKEFGGFFWYVYANIREFDYRVRGGDLMTPVPPKAGYRYIQGPAGLEKEGQRQLESDVLALSVKLSKYINDPSQDAFWPVVMRAMEIATMLGFSIDAIIEENSAVLRSRRDRGVIKGEGDER